MSFSSDTREELCREQVSDRQSAVAECYGVLLFCNTFTDRGIKIITASVPFAKRLPRLFRRAFGFDFDLSPENISDDRKMIFELNTPQKIAKILDTYGYDSGRLLVHHINRAVLEDEQSRVSFMRGVFLTGGSVTDPQKRYHLEFVTDHYYVNRELLALLSEMGFEPKETSRGGNYIAYIKQSEAIEDMLTTLGAPVSAMAIMEAKIMKDVKNSVNRRVNCDTANVTKTVYASQEQIEAIKRLSINNGLDKLSEKLRRTAELRIENPELSIGQLAELSEPPVSKSCMNHRLRKLVELSEGL
ncbi:MAG: DNA-binding protein WhiA [Oscillospiraceae bacterium]|nr:DNA-binding protein WhiA [Oscillospiraceae bacterium]